ncbi:hypothetical protein ILUMI_00197 [Ignelater luminosus]|uniref:Reverse transcriptase/retrotransposon-derived protein RNase H-like domain-containing protein n=1 Tax=Ignelater luminosus TaxID=2038154 RepID=A0A8K0DKN9_IGNLU|nr:hypothetical protein ILUMI_00197 [Ignelater luminosus]
MDKSEFNENAIGNITNKIKHEFSDLSDGKLRKYKHLKVKLDITSGACPKFYCDLTFQSNPEYPIILECDATNEGIDAVLLHMIPDGDERSMCGISRTLNKVEKGYSVSGE